MMCVLHGWIIAWMGNGESKSKSCQMWRQRGHLCVEVELLGGALSVPNLSKGTPVLLKRRAGQSFSSDNGRSNRRI